ncbi:chorismate mutase [Salinicoccus hispanicus]|uniref:Chorismate mutase n=1 Tax=Salinicoccus hispanicus TaxID=157225 RepID=A0A6N8U5E8_9STAP|nr:chorismate mutase [Salinicoccus hispanicus]MXQ51715.1 chorismate mutase [Salinicoccus hispanicus]
MNTHEKLRYRIDELDAELIALFEARMQVAENIAEYKMQNNIPVFDEAREEQVVCRNVGRLQDQSLEIYADSFFRHLMALSKKRQHENLKNCNVSHKI